MGKAKGTERVQYLVRYRFFAEDEPLLYRAATNIDDASTWAAKLKAEKHHGRQRYTRVTIMERRIIDLPEYDA